MEKILRLFCRRPHLLKILTLLFLILPLTVFLSGTNMPHLLVYLLIALIVLVIFGLVSLAAVFLLNPKIQALNQQCDPAPLEEVTRFLLTCPIQGPARINVQLNLSAALRESGDYEEALRFLEQVDLTSTRNLSPTLKFMYANNYADLMDRMGRNKDADRWHNKALKTYQAIPSRDGVNPFESPMRLSEAAAYCRQEKFEKAVSALANFSGDPRHMVEQNLILGRCAVALKNPEKARRHLQYVIDNGNALHMVSEARAMLENL